MKLVRVINRTRGEVLAERAELADNIWTRFCGLMGRPSLPPGSGHRMENLGSSYAVSFEGVTLTRQLRDN